MLFRSVFLILCATPILSYSNNYSVQKNDSLWKIATQHKISISDIRKLNGLYRDHLEVGQKLYIPSHFTNYTTKTGDTFESIKDTFNTKIEHIVTLNNLSENHVIEGQSLRVPITTTDSTPTTLPEAIPVKKESIKTTPVMYKVRRGDTLSDIALKYQTTVPKLKSLNNKASSSIGIGENLVVGNKAIPNTTKNTKKTSYTVKRGDTLGQIAINHGVSSADLRGWNNKKNSTIYPGEKLELYGGKNAISSDDGYKTLKYTVRRGENLSFIAAKFKTSPRTIQDFNNKKSDKIYAGEVINIRVKSTTDLEHSSKARTENTTLIRYKVKRGNTLDDIAIKYKVRRSQLLSWNNKRNTTIYIGENLKIYIPKKVSNPGPKASKKAQYVTRKSAEGIRSNRFKDIPLPIKISQVTKATSSGRGVDIILKEKSSLLAPVAASIQYAGYINALQNVVILQLSDNRNIVYAGLEKLNVSTGQNISKGDVLGVVGVNKLEKAPKFYLELRDNDKVANVLHSYSALSKKQ